MSEKNESRVMPAFNWLRIASGLALVFTSAVVVVQSLQQNEFSNQLYYGTSLIAVFGYIFLTSRSEEEKRDSPWWW